MGVGPVEVQAVFALAKQLGDELRKLREAMERNAKALESIDRKLATPEDLQLNVKTNRPQQRR